MKLYFYYLHIVPNSRPDIRVEEHEAIECPKTYKLVTKPQYYWLYSKVNKSDIGKTNNYDHKIVVLDKRDDLVARQIFIEKYKEVIAAAEKQIEEWQRTNERDREIMAMLEEMEDEENGQV